MIAFPKSTQDIIVASLKQRIAKQNLLPGTELKQVELAKYYGVSRMPVREALQTLLNEGLVTRLSNRHMVIAETALEKVGGKWEPSDTAAKIEEESLRLHSAYKKITAENGGQLPTGKIHLLPAREQVASYLRKAILRREIPEDSVLTLEETAQQLGVSATPVREALQLLATQGLVKLRPNKGAVVLGVDEKAIRDHFAVRTLLEGEAAALAARPESNLTEVEKVFAGMQQCMQERNYTHYKEYNESFHMAIWEAADNPKMTQILASLWNGLSLGFLVTEKEYARISFLEHKQFMEALREHNPEKARRLMQEHMHRSMENILSNYQKQGKKE